MVNGKEIRWQCAGPGLLFMESIRCGAVNAREEAIEFQSFR